MTDTNQLPTNDLTGTQALWPQMIKALAEIDRALGLPDDGCNSLAQTLEAIRALQALAQVQGEPFAWVEHHKGGDNLVWDEPGGRKSPLYTTPQPAQATQAEVTELSSAVVNLLNLLEDDLDALQISDDQLPLSTAAWNQVSLQARAILDLRPAATFCVYCGGNDEDPVDHCMDCTRPAAVPMTPEQRHEIICRYDEGKTYSDLVGIILATEAKHGITAAPTAVTPNE